MKPTRTPEDQAERDALLLGMAREGYTLTQIGVALSVTRQAVHQRLSKQGLSIKDFPRPPRPPRAPRPTVPCTYCGAPVVPTKRETAYGLHSCPAPDCRRAYWREMHQHRRWGRPPVQQREGVAG